MGGITALGTQGGFLPNLARWLHSQPRLPEVIWLPTRPAVQDLRSLLGGTGFYVLPTLRTLAWDPDLDGPLPGPATAPATLENALWIDATRTYWPQLAPASLLRQAQKNRLTAMQLMLTGCTTEILDIHLTEAGRDFNAAAPDEPRLKRAWTHVRDGLLEDGFRTAAEARVTAQKILTERMRGHTGREVMAGFSELTGCEKPLVQACLAHAENTLVLAGSANDALLSALLAELGWEHGVETVEPPAFASQRRCMATARPQAEARTVSRAIRQGWANGIRQMAVVCPDGEYRHRVAAQLRLDGIGVTMESGLLHTPAGHLASRSAAVAAAPQPIALAALGSIPAVADFADWPLLDRLVWRGVAAESWEEWIRKAFHLADDAPDLGAMTEQVAGCFADVPAQGMTGEAWSKWLTTTLHTLAPAWQTLHGAAQLTDWLAEMANVRISMNPATWALWVDTTLTACPVNTDDGITEQRPHVEILAPAAARLRSFGMIVIGGANEGTWPGNASGNDLTPAQRQTMGLPDALQQARMLGHDWQTLLTAAPQIVICRSLDDNGTPTVASRWWDELDATAAPELAAEDDAVGASPKPIGAWPALDDRWPETWSATWVRRLMGCPYRAVGEGLMKLNAFEDYGGVPDRATTGTLVHRCVEAFWRQQPGWPEAWAGPLTEHEKAAATNRMQEIIRHGLRDEPVLAQRLWEPRVRPLSLALIEGWIGDQAEGRTPAMLEHKLDAPIAGIRLLSRADRVDRDAAGTHIVIDYKTGSLPKPKEMTAGREPQLAVEGWLLKQAGLPLGHAEYWRLKGYGTTPLQRQATDAATFALQVEAVGEHLPQLVGAFGKTSTFAATPEPDGVCSTCKLAGLCRWRESHA